LPLLKWGVEGVIMADDENVVKQGESETPPESTTGKETTSSKEPEVPETPEKAEITQEPPDLSPEEKKSLSEKAQKRMQYLANKAKEASEKKPIEESSSPSENKFLGAIPQPTAVSQQFEGSQNLPWEQPPSEPQDKTFEEYERDVTQKADAIASARVAQTEFRLRKEAEIKDDYKTIVNKWDELNPESSSYNEDLSNKLAGIFEKQLRADPKTRLADFVNSIMDVRQGGKEKGKEEVTNKLVEQKAEAAVTPSPETGPEPEDPAKLFQDPSKIKEQEAYLKEQGMWE